MREILSSFPLSFPFPPSVPLLPPLLAHLPLLTLSPFSDTADLPPWFLCLLPSSASAGWRTLRTPQTFVRKWQISVLAAADMYPREAPSVRHKNIVVCPAKEEEEAPPTTLSPSAAFWKLLARIHSCFLLFFFFFCSLSWRFMPLEN